MQARKCPRCCVASSASKADAARCLSGELLSEHRGWAARSGRAVVATTDARPARGYASCEGVQIPALIPIMTARKHFSLLLQAVTVWFVFWLIGLPFDYYQTVSTLTMAIASVLITLGTSLAAIVLLRVGRNETRMRRAFWLSLYYTLPFAVLDLLYCVVYLGHGDNFLVRYWYLSIFYVTPWLTFLPTAALLRERVPAAQ